MLLKQTVQPCSYEKHAFSVSIRVCLIETVIVMRGLLGEKMSLLSLPNAHLSEGGLNSEGGKDLNKEKRGGVLGRKCTVLPVPRKG